MDGKVLLILASVAMAASAWSIPYYPAQRAPLRFTRYAPAPPHFRQPIPVPHHITRPIRLVEEEPQRPKREHNDYGLEDYGHDGHDSHEGHENHNTRGVTGPVHTFVKTDKNANYKWGVRHHVGNKYAS